MSITVTSTTDSAEIVNAVNGVKDSTKPVEEKKSASTDEVDEIEENSDTTHDEPDDAEGDENAEESRDEQEDKEDVKDDENKPRKKGFKNRIQKLRSKISEKEQELAYWKEQALKGKVQDQETQKDAGKETKQARENSEVNKGEPDPSDFETNAEYIKALNKYERDLEKAEAKKEAEVRAQREAQEKITKEYDSRLDQFKKAQPDFDDVVAEFRDIYGDFNASPKIMEALMTSDYGPQVVYEVLKDHKEYERLANLSEARILLEIGKIEARIEKASESSQKPIKKSTQAPPPPKPVGSSKAPVKKSIHDPSLSFSEYERLRNEQLKNR